MARPEARIRTATIELDVASTDFEAVYRQYAGYVARIVVRHADRPSDVDDLVQEVFLRAYRSWPALDLDRPIRPWLRKIAESTCIDAWKTNNRKRRPKIIFGDFADDWAVGAFADPAEIFHAKQISDTVNDALEALEPRQRRVLLMKELDAIGCESIAVSEGTTAQGLRATLTRARKRFRRQYVALAHERGLGALIFAPIGSRLRGWRRRIHYEAIRFGLVPSSSPVELMGPAAAQAVKGLVAATVFVAAAIPAVGGLPGRSVESILDLQTARSEANDGVGSSDAGRLGSRADRQAGAASAATETGGAAGSDGDSGSLPLTPPGSPGDVGDRHGPAGMEAITNPNRGVHDIEDTKVNSYAYAPGDDSAIFASGRNRGCEAHCPTLLLLSTDGGASWSLLAGEGFESDQIFLPPAFPTDNRIFGLTPAGALQVSTDRGDTFGPAAAGSSSFSGPAAMSPRFNAGDPRIVIGTQSGLAQYADNTGTMGPAPYSVPPGGTLQPTYAPNGRLMVGGLLPDETRDLGAAVFACDGSVCEGTRIGNDRMAPTIRPTADPDVVFAFTEQSIFRSTDGSASFDRVSRPGSTGVIRDVAFNAEGWIFAGVWDSEHTMDNGLWSSSDNGATWTVVDAHVFEHGARLIRASGARMVAALGVSGAACSPDSGRTWAKKC